MNSSGHPSRADWTTQANFALLGGMFDDDLPRPKPKLLSPPVLDKLSVDELDIYIADLHAEIARAEADKAKKAAWKSAADDLFKK